MRDNFDEINVKEVKELTKNKLITLGKNIKQMREESGLTLNDLSFFSYINLDSIYRLEKGRLDNTTLLSLFKLCCFFEVELNDLLN